MYRKVMRSAIEMFLCLATLVNELAILQSIKNICWYIYNAPTISSIKSIQQELKSLSALNANMVSQKLLRVNHPFLEYFMCENVTPYPLILRGPLGPRHYGDNQ